MKQFRVAKEQAKQLAAEIDTALDETLVVFHIPNIDHDVLTIQPKDGERILIVLEENAEALFLERQGTGTYSVDILARDNANIRYYSHTTQGTVTRRAHMQRDARIFWVDATYGTASSDVTTYLAEGADAEFHSVFLGTKKHTFTVKSKMVHVGSHSTSNMRSRAVMLDESTGTYEGLIRILPDAKSCDAYQKEDTLLLSPDARMSATPNLEISNEDVRCSHGVSLGQVDEEKLFYFLSRGISRADATRLIVQGFFDTILDEMGTYGTEIKEQLLKQVTV